MLYGSNVSLKLINSFVPNAPFTNPFLYLPYGFLMFLRGRERVHWEQMG